ncbi:MAG: hypothetical protein HQ572_01010, partial [Candidatus Omnitrophica bacterium]|nr:hypothetical protein [Candidatus Omnitrophota bacterium]
VLMAQQVTETVIDETGQTQTGKTGIGSVKSLLKDFLSNANAREAIQKLTNHDGEFTNLQDINSDDFKLLVGQMQSLYRIRSLAEKDETLAEIIKAADVKELLEKLFSITDASGAIISEQKALTIENTKQKRIIFERIADDRVEGFDVVNHLTSVLLFKVPFEEAFKELLANGENITLADRGELTDRGKPALKLLEEIAFLHYYSQELGMDTLLSQEEFVKAMIKGMAALVTLSKSQGDEYFSWHIAPDTELSLDNQDHLSTLRSLGLLSAVINQHSNYQQSGNDEVGINAVKEISKNMTSLLQAYRKKGIVEGVEDHIGIGSPHFLPLLSQALYNCTFLKERPAVDIEERLKELMAITDAEINKIRELKQQHNLAAEVNVLNPDPSGLSSVEYDFLLTRDFIRVERVIASQKAAEEETFTNADIMDAMAEIGIGAIERLGLGTSAYTDPNAAPDVVLRLLAEVKVRNKLTSSQIDEAIDNLAAIDSGQLGSLIRQMVNSSRKTTTTASAKGSLSTASLDDSSTTTSEQDYWRSAVGAAVAQVTLDSEESDNEEVYNMLLNDDFRFLFNKDEPWLSINQSMWDFMYSIAHESIGAGLVWENSTEYLESVSNVRDMMTTYADTFYTYVSDSGMMNITSVSATDFTTALCYAESTPDRRSIAAILFGFALLIDRDQIPHINIDTGSGGMITLTQTIQLGEIELNLQIEIDIVKNTAIVSLWQGLHPLLSSSDNFGDDSTAGKIIRQIV